ncbi:MAG: class I SAM-dependent methyltransferase [Patescibacteria group bacterium]|nr:class I SAM-dependent methyltransferase [Patescibacteria group bacterium]
MILETFKHFPDFELLDTGDGFRLERWGDAVLQRPDPQIIWPKSRPNHEWNNAWAIFKSASEENKGRWEIKKPLPNPWLIEFDSVKFLLKLSPFKHTGLFAEQAAQWEFMLAKIRNKSENQKLKILNLFAYTGGATLVLAKAGCLVTHVDASKPAITWANENHKLNTLPADSVRWILDDAVKFVRRELKRGAKYDGIIMDPPAFGHGPTGKTWKFNDDLPGLLNDCTQLLSDNAKFLIINGYATNSSALALNNLLTDAVKNLGGGVEFGELCLKQKSQRLISTGIFARWSKG